MEVFSSQNLQIFGQLALAVLLGAVIGLERELARKTAGMRTFALVAMGAALFSIISKYGFPEFLGVPGFDPSRIASQIVVGIGFLGAGLIILRQEKVRGLTTAAGLWVSAAIGMAVGFELYAIAVFATVLTILIFLVLWTIEHRLIKHLPYERSGDDDDEGI